MEPHLEKDLYLEKTTDSFQQLSVAVFEQSRNWEPFVVDLAKRQEIYQCKQISCKGLIVQLFIEHVCTCSAALNTKLIIG